MRVVQERPTAARLRRFLARLPSGKSRPGKRNGPENPRPSGTVVSVFVKVCGITTEEDALLAVAVGADALGFVFAPGSPRQVTPGTVRDIVRRLPSGAVTVGVFRDERPERIVEIVNTVGLSGAQLHGREPTSEVRSVRRRIPFVIQAFAAGDVSLATAGGGPADVILIDAPEPGSGRVFDWALAEGAPDGVRLLLAGGLDVDNVRDAVRRVRPWGVDVSSGVETTAGSGRKDATKLRLFVEAARAAGEEVEADGWTPTAGNGSGSLYDWNRDPKS
jgi:phosphoribosylanthranilate isomerase